MTNEIKIVLEGLHCAHCAGKIEERVKNMNNVENAFLNFINKEITVKIINTEDKSNTFNEIVSAVKNIEPDVNVYEKKESYVENEKKSIVYKAVIRFVLGLCVAVCAVVFEENTYASFGLFVTAYLIFGYDVVWKAVKNIFNGNLFDENFLMSIATVGAFFIGDYTEAVAVMLFYQAGEFFQDLAVERSRKSIKGLMNIVSETANVFIDGEIKTVRPENINISDIVLVKPGEKIPVDGIITEGSSMLDMSALTGESIPKSVEKGSTVLSGSINQSSVLKVKAEKRYEQSTISKVLELVENAGNKKSKTENFITKFAKIYTPAVVGAALCIAFIPWVVTGFSDIEVWISRALVFLVSSCPCALVVSVPLGFFSGIGSASKNGVLIKGSNYLQALNEVGTVVFDKTGTLTKGVFEVESIIAKQGEKKELLKYAYSIERFSNHPLAKAIVRKFESEYGGECYDVEDFQEMGGFGLKGMVDGKILLAGNASLIEKYDININRNNNSATDIFIVFDGKVLGEIAVRDTIKEGSFEAVKKLKARGIKTVMLTGDKKETAKNIGDTLGVDRIFSDMLPQDKVHKLEEIMSENKNRKTIFVGDGINDAPVLARADVGIAMGGIGSDAAIEAADAVIMTDELGKIDYAIEIASNTVKIVRENVAFVLAVKFVVLTAAVFGFASMWLAVFADVGVALIAILNSVRKKIAIK